uniref:Glucoside xylosyltransferase 1 n=1 Tax=Knipowitschia caucasica TaxID=637954 RepID=A0AAV2IUC8_KNICA
MFLAAIWAVFPSENAAEWKKLFKPCASQRLFLPLILKGVDSVVYVDSDIVFLQPVDRLWALLSRFNSTQLAAMAPEHEEPRIAWYNRFARHPYYGRTGINSGVMLMNMTRMRDAFFLPVLQHRDPNLILLVDHKLGVNLHLNLMQLTYLGKKMFLGLFSLVHSNYLLRSMPLVTMMNYLLTRILL